MIELDEDEESASEKTQDKDFVAPQYIKDRYAKFGIEIISPVPLSSRGLNSPDKMSDTNSDDKPIEHNHPHPNISCPKLSESKSIYKPFELTPKSGFNRCK